MISFYITDKIYIEYFEKKGLSLDTVSSIVLSFL